MSTDSYYASTAYQPDRIPEQVHSVPRTWIRKFSKARLPWGNTQEVTPADFLCREDPKHMRALEKDEQERQAGTYKPAPFEHLDFHYMHDQEKLRFAQLPGGSRALMIGYLFGKFSFLISFPIFLIVCIALALDSRNPFFSEFMSIFIETSLFLCFPLLFLWGGDG